MHFGILGPLDVVADDGRPVELPSHKLRSLLAMLVIDANRVVSLDRIIDQLWGDEPPATATGTLQAYVSQLRRLVEPGRRPRQAARVLVTHAPGYVLRAGAEEIDALCFDRLVEDAEKLLAGGRADEAEASVAEALALWRGDPLADVAGEPFAQPEIARLVERKVQAEEHRVDAWLAQGRHGVAVTELERLVGEHPLRERLWGQWMLALYRCERQADALRAYQRCRQVLGDELGLEPGPELRRLEQAVVAQDPSLELVAPRLLPRPPPTPATAAARTAPAPATPTGTSTSAPRADPVEDHPGGDGPLVGREPQLRRLAERVVQAAEGQGGVVLVEGEPGIGKTRLVEEASTLAAAQGMIVCWSRCAEAAGAPPYWPWIQVLRALGHHDGQGRAGGEALAVGLSEGLGHGASGDPAEARFRLHQEVAEHLLAAARRRPLLVVIDDLHWADASSRQLLAFLAGELARAPMAVVATVRQHDAAVTDLEDLLGSLARERNSERLTLRGLDPADIERYLELAAGTPAPDPGLASALHDRTDGNPFFLIELVRLLTSERTIDQLGAGDAAALDVPGSVRDTVHRRLARLPEDTQTLLRMAAMIGRRFDLDLLGEAAAVEPDRLVALVEPALAVGLVVEDADTWSCRFSHALVRETLDASLSRLQRARIHRRVGEALERMVGPDGGRIEEHLHELAHHFVAAVPTGTADKAVDYARRAAQRAERVLAHDEAVRHWELALSALASKWSDYQEQRYQILLGLGEARRWAGDVTGAATAVEEAVDIALRLDDSVRAARAAVVFGGVALWNLRAYGVVNHAMVGLLADLLTTTGSDHPELRAQLLGTLAVELYYSDERTRREASAAEAVELARGVGDARLLGRVLNNAYLAQWTPDREVERRAITEEALSLVGRGLPRQTEVIARIHRMWSLLRRGELETYDAELETCRRLAGEVRITEVGAQVAEGEAGRAILAGHWDDAEQLAAEAFRRLSATSLWGAQWCQLVQLLTMRREQGRLDELLPRLLARCEEPGGEPLRPAAVLALAHAGRHDEAHARIDIWGSARPTDWSWDFTTAQWAEVAAILGRPDPQTLYDDLAPLAECLVVAGTGVTSWGSTQALLGRLAVRLGRTQAALEHLGAAVADNSRLGARPFEARARYELARLASRHPTLAPAVGTVAEIIAPAVSIARTVGMHALLADLADLGRETRPPADDQPVTSRRVAP